MMSLGMSTIVVLVMSRYLRFSLRTLIRDVCGVNICEARWHTYLINLNGRIDARNASLASFSSRRHIKLVKMTKKSSLHW